MKIFIIAALILTVIASTTSFLGTKDTESAEADFSLPTLAVPEDWYSLYNPAAVGIVTNLYNNASSYWIPEGPLTQTNTGLVHTN